MVCCQKMGDVIDDTKTLGVNVPTERGGGIGLLLGLLAGIGLLGALIFKK